MSLPRTAKYLQKWTLCPLPPALQVCASCFLFLTDSFKEYVFLPIWKGPTLPGKIERRLHTYILSRKINSTQISLIKVNYFSLPIVSHAWEHLRVYHGVTCRWGNCPTRRESRVRPFHPTAKQTFPPDAPVPHQHLLTPTSLLWLPYHI